MASVNYKSLLEDYRQGGRRPGDALQAFEAGDTLAEMLRTGDAKVSDFDLGKLFAECVGWQKFAECRNGRAVAEALMEADAVTAASFSNITGQIVYAALMESFTMEANVFTPLVPTVPTRSPSGEKIAGIGGIGDETTVIGETEEYPNVSFDEDWIRTPVPVKRGMICPVTREAILFDRTGMVLQQAQQIGAYMGANKETRIIDCIVDENTTAARYNRKDAGAVVTYDDNSGAHDWDNLAASNALVDWTDVENAELLLAAITDPNSGEPVNVMATDLIVTPDLLHTARRIVNATEIRFGDGASATTQAISANPLQPYTIRSSNRLKARMATDTSWFLGNIAKAFRYMEVWPVTVSQAPQNSEAEFTRDIVMRFKASEYGAAATFEPRYMAKSTA